MYISVIVLFWGGFYAYCFLRKYEFDCFFFFAVHERTRRRPHAAKPKRKLKAEQDRMLLKSCDRCRRCRCRSVAVAVAAAVDNGLFFCDGQRERTCVCEWEIKRERERGLINCIGHTRSHLDMLFPLSLSISLSLLLPVLPSLRHW